ncbi:hypothetical protein F5146DRAFT_995544 [Armillaria mellea]|nr:hypothetical protein F5146DRAFT_995544 [Armillaria mellea]
MVGAEGWRRNSMIVLDKRLRDLCHREWNRVKDDPNMRVRGFESVPKRCATCRDVSVNQIVCQGCNSFFYCSSTCLDTNRQDRQRPFSNIVDPGHEKDCQVQGIEGKVSRVQVPLGPVPVGVEGIVRESRGVLGSGSEFGCRLFRYTLITLGELPEEESGWKLPDEETPWLKDARMKVPSDV